MSKAELRVPGREAFEYWEELVNEANKSWFRKKKTGNLRRTFAILGSIVVAGLLESMESYSELAALLSHEFTHVEKRHATRSIFRRLGSDVFIGVLFGEMSSIAGVLAGQANEIRSLSYSRSLEKEADL